MHQLRAGINAGSKQELARGLPFGANRSQNPAAAEERPPQDRDAAAFRTPGGRWRVGVGWAAAPALRHTGSPRLGRARGRGMPFPGASSLQTCSNPPPPSPHRCRGSNRSAGVSHPTKAPHVTSADGRAAKPEERSGSPAAARSCSKVRKQRREVRAEPCPLAPRRPSRLGGLGRRRRRGARLRAPDPPGLAHPGPAPRGARGDPRPPAPRGLRRGHLCLQTAGTWASAAGSEGCRPAAAEQRRRAAAGGRLSSRHLHPGCRGCCPCSEPSNGSGLWSWWWWLLLPPRLSERRHPPLL